MKTLLGILLLIIGIIIMIYKTKEGHKVLDTKDALTLAFGLALAIIGGWLAGIGTA